MTVFTRTNTLALIDAAMDNSRKGDTMHLPGRSGHGRFIVGGVTPSIRLPHHTVRHPATVGYVTEQIVQALKDYPRAETVGSWRDEFTGHVYIDLGTTHDDRDTAVYIAGVRGELAIYDSHDDAVERVSASGVR